MTDQTGPAPASWCDALEAEFQALYGEPALDADAPIVPEARLRAVHARIHAKGPSAVCLSGGGVRSATFALGVLQGLAHIGVLRKVDYLSTVSGGGYIGGWLTAWLHRAGPGGQAEVMRQLDPEQSGQVGSLDTETPVDRVRRTARYLALQGGVVSADMWTLVGTMARNLLLNWMVLLPLLAAALLVPHIYYAIVHAIEVNLPPSEVCGWAELRPGPRWMLIAGLGGFLVSSSFVILTFMGAGGKSTQGRFLSLFLLPAVVGAVAATLFWSATPCNLDLRLMVGLAAGVPMAGWLVVAAGRRMSASASTGGNVPGIRVGPRTVLGSIVAGAVIGGGAYWFAMNPFGFGHELKEFYVAFAVPILLGLTVVAMMLFAGIASTEQDDAALEWWSRCGAWLAIAATVWAAAGVLVFYMADFIEAGVQWVARVSPLDHWSSSAGAAVLAPLLSSLAGLAMRNSGGGSANRPSALKLALESLALPLVILALLSTIAWADLRALTSIEYHWPTTHPRGAGLGEVLALFAGLAAFALIMSRLIPVNRFSLHGMYRQRLVRTFLGASRQDRSPNAFTGFDAKDDLRVHDLADVRPLHVVNATLNAVQSTHVGRHERKAESFTFSPLHVGNRFLGYRPTREYGSDEDRAGGVSLGLALAVSGAAASSAMGMYSTKARAFLLTLANARLGLWFGNPQSAKTWRRGEPPLGVEPIAREMLGLTTDNNPYVYLSDGGHYENLALWEMVARRCRYIVVSDGGCDPAYSFTDLSNAVRRIRLDLGIPILFEPLTQTREGQGRTNPHGAIGTIKYSAIDGAGAPDGTILYLKATLSGDEPVDVRNFASADPLFPHDSTSNQFFDEARFESYRALGYHTVLSVTAGLTNLENVEGLCRIAEKTLAPASPAAPAVV